MTTYIPNIKEDAPLTKEELAIKISEAQANLKSSRKKRAYWFWAMCASILVMMAFALTGYALLWLLSVVGAAGCYIFLGVAASKAKMPLDLINNLKPVGTEDINTIEKHLKYKPVRDFRDKVVEQGRELTVGELKAFKLYTDSVEMRRKLNVAYNNDYNLVDNALKRLEKTTVQCNSQ